jgi:hypothetical protein
VRVSVCACAELDASVIIAFGKVALGRGQGLCRFSALEPVIDRSVRVQVGRITILGAVQDATELPEEATTSTTERRHGT